MKEKFESIEKNLPLVIISCFLYIIQQSILNILYFHSQLSQNSFWEVLKKIIKTNFSIHFYIDKWTLMFDNFHEIFFIIGFFLLIYLSHLIINKSKLYLIRVITFLLLFIIIFIIGILIHRYIVFGELFKVYDSYITFIRYLIELIGLIMLSIGLVQLLFIKQSKKEITMFKGNSSISFKTSNSFKEVFDLLEDELSTVGNIESLDSGQIKINPANYSGILTKSTIEGTIRQKEDKFFVSIDYNSTLSLLGWIILVVGIFIYGLGILVLFAPGLTRSEIKGRLERVLDNIRFQYKQ